MDDEKDDVEDDDDDLDRPLNLVAGDHHMAFVAVNCDEDNPDEKDDEVAVEVDMVLVVNVDDDMEMHFPVRLVHNCFDPYRVGVAEDNQDAYLDVVDGHQDDAQDDMVQVALEVDQAHHHHY